MVSKSHYSWSLFIILQDHDVWELNRNRFCYASNAKTICPLLKTIQNISSVIVVINSVGGRKVALRMSNTYGCSLRASKLFQQHESIMNYSRLVHSNSLNCGILTTTVSPPTQIACALSKVNMLFSRVDLWLKLLILSWASIIYE